MKSLKSNWWALACIILITACGGEEVQEAKTLRPVVFQEVGYETALQTRTFSGTAETDKVINLSFRNNGIITLFNIRLGQVVRKGQLLAQLDNVQARLGLEQAQASLTSAESQMNTAKLGYDRIRSLYEKGSASLSDFENAKNSWQTAQSSYASAQRSVDIQEEQINYGYIYAPENGVIAAVNAEIDENVSPGQVVAVLNAGNEMTIAMGIPESVINQVKECSNVTVTFPALTGQRFDGQVTEVSPAVDRSTATYPIKVTLLAPTEDVKSGMAANVTFSFGQLDSEALIIPAKAVGEDSKGRFVFLVNGSGESATIKKQHIQIGDLTPLGFEVTGGLSEGQKIATAGLQTLLDGQEVSLKK